MDYWHLLTMLNIYVILALSLNIVVGYVGLVSLSHAAFYGIGAYIGSLCLLGLNLGFVPSVLLSFIGAMLLSLIVSVPALRLKGDYFILASLAFQVIVFILMYNWINVTKGPDGISGIPRPEFMGMKMDTPVRYSIFSGAIASLSGLCIWKLLKSPFGRALKSIRENELAAVSLGKNIFVLKLVALSASAGFASISGVLFASYASYIDPTSFSLSESIFILSIVIIGGTGNVRGPLVGTIIMILLPEALRHLRLPSATAANIQQIFYGILIIVIMRYKPKGIWGEYRVK